MTSGHGLGARSGHFLLNSRYARCFPGFWETLTYCPPSSQALNLLIATGETIPLRGLEGVPGLPGAPQDEAGLHEEIRDEPRGWGHMPNAPDSPVRP